MKSFLIADDHEIVRLGVSNALKTKYPGASIFHSESVNEIQNIVSKNQIDLIILDIKMPGGSTIDLVKSLKANYPKLKILIFTALNENQYGTLFMRLGVEGFLSKLKAIDDVLDAIKALENGMNYISPNLAYKIKAKKSNNNSILENLSPRELEIIELIADGFGNLEISHELDLKTSTVSTYKKRILEKFRAEHMVELIDLYRQQLKQLEE